MFTLKMKKLNADQLKKKLQRHFQTCFNKISNIFETIECFNSICYFCIYIFLNLWFLFITFQLNQVTSWIDGSFIYSTSEPWINAMRSFQNGTLLTDSTGTMPIRNYVRVPLFNNPVPHMMKMLSTERLFCKD